jgi:hypothetical protein
MAINTAEVARKAKPYGPLAEGAAAFRRGESPCRCPYVFLTDPWGWWWTGWSTMIEKHRYIRSWLPERKRYELD